LATKMVADNVHEEKKRRRGESVDKKKYNSAWSNRVQKKGEKEKRKEKKTRRKIWVDGHEDSRAEGNNPKRSRAEDDNGADWEELAREERVAKKVRIGQVSQRTFDEEFAME
jgi:ATP-dependent RNA helicase DDX55/SPB4